MSLVLGWCGDTVPVVINLPRSVRALCVITSALELWHLLDSASISSLCARGKEPDMNPLICKPRLARCDMNADKWRIRQTAVCTPLVPSVRSQSSIALGTAVLLGSPHEIQAVAAATPVDITGLVVPASRGPQFLIPAPPESNIGNVAVKKNIHQTLARAR